MPTQQANSGPNTNGCQFFITVGPADWLGAAFGGAGRAARCGLAVSLATANGSPSAHPGNLPLHTHTHTDGKHVVFGRVLGESMLTVRKLEAVATGPNNRPKLPCVVTMSGEM